MTNSHKIIIATFIVGLLLFLMPTEKALAGTCAFGIKFVAKPILAPVNQDVTFSGEVTVFNFEPPGSANAGFCMYSGTQLISGSKPLKRIVITFNTSGIDSTALHQIYIDLIAFQSSPYSFSEAIKPSDFGKQAGQNFTISAVVCPFEANSGAICPQHLTDSGTGIRINLIAGVSGAFGCVDNNGIYRCSPGMKPDCSDVTACQGKTCQVVPDINQCDKTASQTHKGCQNNTCVNISGAGTDACTTNANCTATGGGPTTSQYVFNLENPIGVTNFQDLINIIGVWIFNLAIPIAVIIIIYAGVLMLTSGGNPGRFQKGAKALWYAVIGLAVVLIGKGFVTLVQSILSLKK